MSSLRNLLFNSGAILPITLEVEEIKASNPGNFCLATASVPSSTIAFNTLASPAAAICGFLPAVACAARTSSSVKSATFLRGHINLL